MYFQEDLKEVLICWLLLFSLIGDFHFWATFLCYQRSVLVSQTREGPHQLCSLPWLLLFGYFSRLFLSAVCPIRLRTLQVWANVFYPQAFFTFHFFPNFDAFVIQMQAGTLLHSKSFFMFAIIKFPLSASTWPWTTNDIRLLSYNQASSIK